MDYYDNMMIELAKKRNKEEKKNILILLDQMIEKAKADDVHDKIRALQNPYPNAFITCKDGTKLYLTESKVGDIL